MQPLRAEDLVQPSGPVAAGGVRLRRPLRRRAAQARGRRAHRARTTI